MISAPVRSLSFGLIWACGLRQVRHHVCCALLLQLKVSEILGDGAKSMSAQLEKIGLYMGVDTAEVSGCMCWAVGMLVGVETVAVMVWSGVSQCLKSTVRGL